jgi:hypothetical protein
MALALALGAHFFGPKGKSPKPEAALSEVT